MYRLYSIPGSCSTGIHVLINKLGQDVEIVSRDEVADYAHIVPTNQVPALITEDEELLTEGGAIALHLLDKHGMAPLPGGETREFRQWLMFNYATLHPTYSKLLMANNAEVVADEASRSAQIAYVAERLSTLWGMVEARLQDRQFMVGSSATIIDYLLALYANWGNGVPEANIEIGPRTRETIERVTALPEFRKAAEREGIDVQLPR